MKPWKINFEKKCPQESAHEKKTPTPENCHWDMKLPFKIFKFYLRLNIMGRIITPRNLGELLP